MPTLEIPPNPAPVEEKPARLKVSAGRYGELDHHELVRLLDTLDDDRSRSRFRESIYISLLFYVVLGWFVLYGPKVLWHTPQVIPVVTDEKKHELTYLDTPNNLSKLIPKESRHISDKTAVAQTTHPEKSLEATRRAGEPAPAPKPLPPAPQPQPAPTQSQAPPAPPQPRPLPPVQQPHPQPNQSIPDAPRPSASRPTFSSPQTAGDSIAQAAHDAVVGRGAGGEEGAAANPRRSGPVADFEVLSDTQGVDFGPYIKRLLTMIKTAWIPQLPEETHPPLNKKGVTLIRFTIMKDGSIGDMHLDNSTHDEAIDRAAWSGITSNGVYPPLPPSFKGKELDLRIQFNVNQTVDRHSAE